MPNYDYRCRACEHEVIDHFTTISKREELTKEPCPSCGELEVFLMTGAPLWCDAMRMGRQKPDMGFRENVLQRIRDKVPGNTMKQNRFC